MTQRKSRTAPSLATAAVAVLIPALSSHVVHAYLPSSSSLSPLMRRAFSHRPPLSMMSSSPSSPELPSYLTESNDGVGEFTSGRPATPSVRLVSSVSAPPANVDVDERLAADGQAAAPAPPSGDEYETYDMGMDTPFAQQERTEAAAQAVLEENAMTVQDLPGGAALNAVGQSLPWVVTGIPVFFLARRMNRKKVLKQNEAIRDFAVEMAYHDGNERELVLCLKEYKKKLPRGRRNDMIDNYLAEYFKVKTVSLNTITNLASVFTLLKLDEVSAAKRLVAAGELLKSKPSSRSKCLFFGDRILKSPEALDALKPLRDMLASNYRRGGAEIVRVSQETMAEAAYKSIVAAAGPDQTSATPGYNILGISKDRAQEIFDEVASENFETTLQQQQRMMESSKEELVTKKDDPKSEGGGGDEVDVMKQVLEENSAEDLEKSKEKKAPAELSIYECETCGYTLFPSSGRDFKFFPDDFVCPECQAPKDKFVQKKQNIDS